MNQCNNWRIEIQNYLDDRSPLNHDVKEHLEECRDCRDYLGLFMNLKKNSQKELNSFLEKTGKFDLSVLNGLKEFKKQSRAFSFYIKYGITAAALLIILLTSLLFFRNYKNERELKTYIIEENSQFVSSLGENYISDNGNGMYSDWFEGVGLVDEIMGEFEL